MATLVHDDLIDGAEFRRGRASAWSAYGPDAARATGDYLFARAFAELAATGDQHAVALLTDAALCLARGEAMQRRQTHDPDTTVDAYLERCSLKTSKLFEAACLLGGGPGWRHLGTALYRWGGSPSPADAAGIAYLAPFAGYRAETHGIIVSGVTGLPIEANSPASGPGCGKNTRPAGPLRLPGSAACCGCPAISASVYPCRAVCTLTQSHRPWIIWR